MNDNNEGAEGAEFVGSNQGIWIEKAYKVRTKDEFCAHKSQTIVKKANLARFMQEIQDLLLMPDTEQIVLEPVKNWNIIKIKVLKTLSPGKPPC